MARKARLTSKAAKVVTSEFSNVTPVNVIRVPRIIDGKWGKSNRGSLLMDTLCYPVGMAVAVKVKSNEDPAKWVLTIDGADFPIEEAKTLAIGFGSLKDTTTGIEYMLKDKNGDDAIPAATKKVIITRCKRKTTIQRLSIVCKLIDSLATMQGIGNCFSAEEKVELFNTPATLLNGFKDAINSVKEDTKKPQYFSLS